MNIMHWLYSNISRNRRQCFLQSRIHDEHLFGNGWLRMTWCSYPTWTFHVKTHILPFKLFIVVCSQFSPTDVITEKECKSRSEDGWDATSSKQSVQIDINAQIMNRMKLNKMHFPAYCCHHQSDETKFSIANYSSLSELLRNHFFQGIVR
jgi:hypothetical protein